METEHRRIEELLDGVSDCGFYYQAMYRVGEDGVVLIESRESCYVVCYDDIRMNLYVWKTGRMQRVFYFPDDADEYEVVDVDVIERELVGYIPELGDAYFGGFIVHADGGYSLQLWERHEIRRLDVAESSVLDWMFLKAGGPDEAVTTSMAAVIIGVLGLLKHVRGNDVLVKTWAEEQWDLLLDVRRYVRKYWEWVSPAFPVVTGLHSGGKAI